MQEVSKIKSWFYSWNSFIPNNKSQRTQIIHESLCDAVISPDKHGIRFFAHPRGTKNHKN